MAAYTLYFGRPLPPCVRECVCVRGARTSAQAPLERKQGWMILFLAQ